MTSTHFPLMALLLDSISYNSWSESKTFSQLFGVLKGVIIGFVSNTCKLIINKDMKSGDGLVDEHGCCIGSMLDGEILTNGTRPVTHKFLCINQSRNVKTHLVQDIG